MTLNRRTLILTLAAAALLLLLSAAIASYIYQNRLDMPLNLSETEELLVKPGSSLRGVIDELSERGILQYPMALRLHARLQGQARSIQAGEYLLEPGINSQALLEKLIEGRVRFYSLTLIEGWNIREVRQAVADSPYLRHTLDGVDNAELMTRIGHPEQHPEGRFLPETYHFPRGLSDVEFLRRAYAAMEQELAAQWQQRDEGLPYETPDEALVMASIVEKETGQPQERPQIAGVFVRRLQKGMRLQTDPTVIYGLGEAFDGNLRRSHLRSDTPYNTYTRGGLPPTPIAMPGAKAIHAALHPADGESLYFVARGDGSHHFSTTLREHNNAVIKYQLKGRKRSFSSYKAE